MSYIERGQQENETLNAKADPFVPQSQHMYTRLETLKTIKTVSKDVTRSKSQPHPRIKGSIFATTMKNDKGTKEKKSLLAVKSCLFFEGGHALAMCPQLEKRAQREKNTCV